MRNIRASVSYFLVISSFVLAAGAGWAQPSTISSFPYQPNESAQASDFIANHGSGGSAGITATGSSFSNGTISSPRQGTGGTSVQAWANEPTVNYSSDSITWLHSPIFDLSSLSGYQMEFDLWIRTRTASGGDDATDAGLKLQVQHEDGLGGVTAWEDVTTSIPYNGSFSGLTAYNDGDDCWKGTALGGANSNTCRVNLNTWTGKSEVRFRWCFACSSFAEGNATEAGPVLDSFRIVPVVASVGYAGGYAAVPQDTEPADDVQANISKIGGSPFTGGMTVTCLGSGVSATVVSVTDDDNCVLEFSATRTADVGGQTFHIYDGTTRICEGIVTVYYPQQLIPNRQGGTVQEPPLSAVMGGNGVYLHNGEFRHDLPIVSIPGRMLPLGFGITYRSQLDSIGALGAGWVASFERYLTYSSSTDEVKLYSGDGRIDIFPLKSGGTAGAGPYVKPGFFLIINRNDNSTPSNQADDSYTIQYAHGSTSHFNASNLDTAGQQMFRESNFQDRFGNVVIYEYNGSGQLGTIYGDLFDYGDGTRHKLEFDYNAHGRLAKVTDYANYTAQPSEIVGSYTGNREWEFVYNSSAQLTEIKLPKTLTFYSDTKGANYRARVQFTYDSVDNLLEVIDARQANESSPIGWLKNHYDGSDRVDYQDVGRTSSGDATHRQTIIWGTVDGNGQRYVDVVNALKYRSRYQVQASGTATPLGTLLNVRHYTGEWNTNSPPTSTGGQIRGTDEAYYETSYEYDSEFHVIKVTLPRGNYSRFLYDISASDQRARGNLLRVLSHAGTVSTSTLPADQVNGLLATFTYTSVADFNLLATSVGPRAYVLGGSYNFAANTGITTDNSAEFTTTNTYYGASDADGPKGSLKKATTPSVEDTTVSPGSLNDGQYLETILKYNSFGQVISAQDQSSVRTEYEYGTSGFGLGYLHKVKAGANNTYPNVTEFGYNSVGRTITTIDPKGFTYTSYVNQLDQVVKAETPQVAEANNAQYYVKFVYDLNGNLTTSKVSLFTETGSNPYPYTIDTTTAYNILDLATSVVEPIDSTTTRTTSFAYDLLYRHVETTLPEGNKTATDYDELNRAIKAYAGFDTTNVVKSGALIKGEVFFDENSNSIRHLDGRGNDSHTYFDAYDRGFKVEDRLASNPNYSLFEYNAAGQVVKAQRKGVMNVYNSTFKSYSMQNDSILAEKLVDYDNIGRAYRTRVTAKSSEGATLAGVGDSYSTSLVKFRANGQVMETRDDYGIPTKYEYDGYNRLRRVIDDRDGTGDDDNEDEYTYDANGNVIYVTARLWDDADTSTGPHKVLTTAFQYDSLNRLIQETAPNAAVKTWRYDSRSNMVKSVDRVGVTRSTEYDLLGRPIRRKAHDITRRVIDPGTGLVDSSGDFDIASRTIFDKNSNAREAIDPHGNRTYFRYDLADRWLQTQHADGGSSTPNKTTAGATHTINTVGSTPFHSKSDAYDQNSNLLKLTDPNGTVTTWTYDANDMMTLETGDWSAAPSQFEIQGEDEVNLAFDGLYRAVNGETHDSTGQLTELWRTFNTIGCIDAETQKVFRAHPTDLAFTTSGTVESVFNSVGSRLQRKLRDGDTVTAWTFDRKHRPVTTSLTVAGLYSNVTIAEYEYLGGGLLHSRQTKYHPESISTPIISTFKRDALLRITSVRHSRDDSLLSYGERLFGRFDYAYDANSMMRYEARWYKDDDDGRSTTPDEVDFYGYENDSELYKAIYNTSKGDDDNPIDLNDPSNWTDILDTNAGTFSDRVLYSRRLAGTRQRVNWSRGAPSRTSGAAGTQEDSQVAPNQTTNYETSDDPSKDVDTPAGDGQGSRHNYTVIGQVGHTYDHNRNLLADATREFRYNYKNQLRKVWRKSDGESAGILSKYREDAFARQVYTESYWELASRYYLDTRFELDVKVDRDADGIGMTLVDGGMQGTTNAAFAGLIQEAVWPSKIKKAVVSGEEHYYDFHLDVPGAGEDVYLGYVSVNDMQLRIFSDRYEVWWRGGTDWVLQLYADTSGRRCIGIHVGGSNAGFWVDGTQLTGWTTGSGTGGSNPFVLPDHDVGFGSKAVAVNETTYTPGLTLFENLNYLRAYERTTGDIPANAGGRVVVRTFDNPEPVSWDEIPPNMGSPLVAPNGNTVGDATQVLHYTSDGDFMTTCLVDGQRHAAIVVKDGADGLVKDGEETLENPEGTLPGVAYYAIGDATSHVTLYARGVQDNALCNTHCDDGATDELGKAGGNEFGPWNALFGAHRNPERRTEATPPSSSPEPVVTPPPPPGNPTAMGKEPNTTNGSTTCGCQGNPSTSMYIGQTDGSTGWRTSRNGGSFQDMILEQMQGGGIRLDGSYVGEVCRLFGKIFGDGGGLEYLKSEIDEGTETIRKNPESSAIENAATYLVEDVRAAGNEVVERAKVLGSKGLIVGMAELGAKDAEMVVGILGNAVEGYKQYAADPYGILGNKQVQGRLIASGLEVLAARAAQAPAGRWTYKKGPPSGKGGSAAGKADGAPAQPAPKPAADTASNSSPVTGEKAAARNPYGSKGKPDHQEGVKQAERDLQKEAQPGERVITERKVQGIDGCNRRPDAQIVDVNGKTRKIIEVERRPESTRNKAREAEYDGHGIPHETRPVPSQGPVRGGGPPGTGSYGPQAGA